MFQYLSDTTQILDSPRFAGTLTLLAASLSTELSVSKGNPLFL